MRSQPIVNVANALPAVMQGILRNVSAEQAPLLAWPMVCGAQIAAKTTALSFESGVLIIRVADAAWCNELQRLNAQYLAALNTLLPAVVSKIEFKV